MNEIGRGAAWTIALGLWTIEQADASGFAIREQSTMALGNAFAGATAGAEDPSYIFFNPAAMGRLDGYQAAASLAWAMPRSKLRDASANTSAGTPIAGTDSASNIGDEVLIPAFYAVAPVGERVRLGLAVNSPFGLKTNYPDNWVGRYQALKSELRTVDIAPTLAVKLLPGVSLGVGFKAQYADGRLSNAVDFGTIGFGAGIPGAVPGGQDGRVRLEGDDWSYGYTAGLLVEPLAGTRLGVAYRSKVEHTLDGEAHFSGDEAGIATALRASGAFTNTDAKLDVTTPASLSFGVQQDLGKQVSVMAEAEWTDWSQFRELRVKLDNGMQDDVTRERWNDSWFFALGATWRPLDQLTLRTGIAYDQSPVSDRFRTARIPDENRYWLAFGVDWQPKSWVSLGLGYTHIWVEDSEVNLATEGARGSLSARYENGIDVVTAGIRFAF